MSFLAPMMLLGSLAAGIPIALHFFFRSRYQTVPWAAMKFLLDSIEQTSRRLKFQELLLLLVRVALMLVLALALARPMSTMVSGAGQGAAVDTIFLFDTSMSMGGSDGPKSRLERAQDAALSVIDQLPPHSSVQIISCADRAELDWSASDAAFMQRSILGHLGPRASGNLDHARTIIQELKPTNLGTDLKDGLILANAALKRSVHGNKEFYVFTDMQKSAWDTQPSQVAKIMKEIGEQASVTIVRCGQQELTNAAIDKVVSQTDVPRPGERVDFAVQVRHTSGKEAIKNLQLTLLVDGVEVGGETKLLPVLKKGETQSLTLTGKLDTPGLHTVTVLMKDGQDDVPGDNRFDYVVRVPDYFRVLVVDGGDVDPVERNKESLASSFYVMHQIAPVDVKDHERFHIQQKRVRAGQASAAELGLSSSQEKLDLCVLVNCEMPPADQPDKSARNALSHSFLDQLKQYVKNGGSLLVYAGDKVKFADYNKILGEKYNLLPLPLKGKVHEFGNKTPQFLDRETFELPAYRKFRYDKGFGDFNKIEIYKAFALDEPSRRDVRKDIAEDKDKKKEPRVLTDEEKQEEEKKRLDEAIKRAEQEKREENITVIVRYKNGWPAVVTRKIGEGEVIFVTTSAEPGGTSAADVLSDRGLQFTWNNWALNRMSGPFIKSTLAHLMAGRTQEHNFQAGKTFTWNARDNSGKTYTLFHPRTDNKKDGKRRLERLGLPARDEETGKLVVKANDLYHAGIYHIRAAEPSGEGNEDETEDLTDSKSDLLPVAVNPDLNETENFETYTNEELNNFLKLEPPPRFLLAGTSEATATGLKRLNREWTVWLLWLLLILALCEVGLAYWCGRAW